MPITGQETAYKALLETQIEAGIIDQTGFAPQAPNAINGLAKGIADATIPFLVSNILVSTTVTTAVAPHPPGGAAVGTGAGIGTIS